MREERKEERKEEGKEGRRKEGRKETLPRSLITFSSPPSFSPSPAHNYAEMYYNCKACLI